MKEKEFRALASKLLPSLTGFRLHRNLLVFDGIDQVLRGFHVDPSAFNTESFYLTRFFMPLYVPAESVTLTFGRRIQQQWSEDLSKLRIQMTSTASAAASYLSSLSRPLGVVEALREFDAPNATGYTNPHVIEALGYAYVIADLPEEALATLARLSKFAAESTEWERRILQRTTTIYGDIVKDPEVAKQRLYSWKVYTLDKLQLPGLI